MRARLLPRAVLALALALSALPVPTAAAAAGDWFVLRHRQSGDCWTGRLIKISGELSAGSAQVAGGPFPSKEEAEAYLDRLTERGTCTPD